MTYRDLLKELEKNNIERESLIFLVTEKLNISKSSFILSLDKEIDSILLQDITKLKNNIPVQYILGYTYFYKYKFLVTKDTLIPRFDTEVLIEEVINIISKEPNKYKKVVDIGTGTGCIAITLKKELPNIEMDAIDISLDCINVARKNSKLLNTNINFINNDLLNNINNKYDMIISNPPYIDINEDIDDLVKLNEPHLALFSKNKGLFHYEEILKQSFNNLNKGGIIVFEIPSGRDIDIINLVKKYYQNFEIKKDYNNLSRVLIIRS